MPLTNAERCKNYRKRKKDAAPKIKTTPKTSVERSRLYRLRKRQLAQGGELSANEVLCTPSTLNSQMAFEPSPQPVTAGKCSKCERVYLTRKNYLRHVNSCSIKKKVLQAVVEPAVLRSLRRVQIRVARCDDLLESQGTCLVTELSQDYGLDRRCVYPYISSVRSLRIKTEPGTSCDGMVDIGEEIKRELEEGPYVHWDSDASSDYEDQAHGPDSAGRRRPETLSRLALKTIYSERFLGKVPRKRRRIKAEIRDDSAVFEEPVDQFNDDDDELERFGENISHKVASFDDLLRGDVDDQAARTEESRVEKVGEVDATTEGSVGPLDHLDGLQVTEVPSSSVVSSDDKSGNGTSDFSRRSPCDSSVLDVDNEKCVEEKTAEVIDNSESLDSDKVFDNGKEESNMSADNGDESDAIISNEGDEVASKISLDISEGGKVDYQKALNAEDSMDAAETQTEEDGQRRDTPDEEVNGETEAEENFEDNSSQSNDAQAQDKELFSEGSGNAFNERDGEFDEGDGDTTDGRSNHMADERDSDTPECTTDRGCGAPANGINSPKEDEVTGDREGKRSLEFAECEASLNGGDETSEEMDDRRLMEALDAQIGESEGEGDSACDRDKITLADLLPDKAHGRTLDLDSIADEFSFDP